MDKVENSFVHLTLGNFLVTSNATIFNNPEMSTEQHCVLYNQYWQAKQLFLEHTKFSV